MNKLKNDSYSDFWDWLDSISIKYKNYEIKNAIVTQKYSQLLQIIWDRKGFNLRKLLSSIKWETKLSLINNKMLFRKLICIGGNNLNQQLNLRNKNLYVINFSPKDSRTFLHIAPLAENDSNSVVVTVRNDVYKYFSKLGMQTILLDIYNPWRKIEDLIIEAPKIQSRENTLLSLDIFSLISLSRAASLIDLLDILTNKNGLPQTLITLQDYHTFDSVFASYFFNKIPTVTLQHGRAGIPRDIKKNLWKYIISDWMIVFGFNQAEILKSSGVDSKKIKILGTAKYDLYVDKIENKLGNNKNKRVLLGIQQIMFSKENNKIIFDFVKEILPSKEDYKISIRFHPAVTKKNRKIFVKKIKKLNLNYGRKIDISDIEDPLEDISKSTIILVSSTTLGMESTLLKKPVIEYLSSGKDNNKKFGDYRDFVLHAFIGQDAKTLILKLLNNEDFYNKIIEKQNKFVNKEIILPPAIPRILDFIYNLNN